jgi:hypothetical protein
MRVEQSQGYVDMHLEDLKEEEETEDACQPNMS